MIGRIRQLRAIIAVNLATLVFGVVALPAPGQDVAATLSAAFRKASSRVQGSLVTVRRRPEPLVAPRSIMPPTTLSLDPRDLAPPPWTGIVIDPERGHILTTDRPAMGAAQLLVAFPDGSERATAEIRRDPQSNLALLILDGPTPRRESATWGDPGKLEPGDWVLAVGQPGSAPPSLAAGIFSAPARSRRRMA